MATVLAVREPRPPLVAKPFVKWVGGKRELAPKILELLPKRISTYYEPFVGGGAVFFALASERPRRFENAWLYDANIDLMAAYGAVQNEVEELICRLTELQERHSEKTFLEQRTLVPKTQMERAVRCIYLNKTCFNGLYRVNRDGQFNVAYGKHKNPRVCDAEGLRAASEALVGVTLLSSEPGMLPSPVIVSTLWKACSPPPDQENAAVYLDPPYLPAKDGAFTRYTADGFGLRDHEELACFVRRKRWEGHRVVASNADTPMARNLYAGLEIHEVNARRSVNRDGAGRGRVGEILVVNRYVEEGAT